MKKTGWLWGRFYVRKKSKTWARGWALVHAHKVTAVVENRHYLSSSTSLPSPVIPSGFIHVKHKAMNEKRCEAERRRRGKEGERISRYQGNRRHGNYLINEPAMNPSNMVLVKSRRSN